MCVKSTKDSDLIPNAIKEFIVIDIESRKIIYEDRVLSPQIVWESDIELVFIELKGFIISPDDNGRVKYVINLQTKKKKQIDEQKK